jgi:hypothetical protein
MASPPRAGSPLKRTGSGGSAGKIRGGLKPWQYVVVPVHAHERQYLGEGGGNQVEIVKSPLPLNRLHELTMALTFEIFLLHMTQLPITYAGAAESVSSAPVDASK